MTGDRHCLAVHVADIVLIGPGLLQKFQQLLPILLKFLVRRLGTLQIKPVVTMLGDVPVERDKLLVQCGDLGVGVLAFLGDDKDGLFIELYCRLDIHKLEANTVI